MDNVDIRFTGLYLGANRARHNNYNIKYQDLDTKYGCDYDGDMKYFDISPFDYIICTPPCNWWSKANPYYWHSLYALETMNLLPIMIIKCAKNKAPFLIENVKNVKRMKMMKIFDLCDRLGVFYQHVGRHTYFSNISCDLQCPQQQDFKYGGVRVNNDGYNQGGTNVHNVVELWLSKLQLFAN